jgi:peroxiredoxin
MKWLLPIALVLVLLAVWAGISLKSETRGAGSSLSSATSGFLPYEKHYVTPQQLSASGAMSARSVGPITAVGHDGRRREWKELAGAQPVVMVFIKKDCPCNVEFEPFFQRLYQAYRKSVRFLGVIDGGIETAQHYAEANAVPYLVLADPEQVLISRCRAENGAYVALVTPAGVLSTVWPGFSAEMMGELSRQIASLAGVEEQRIETSGLPNVLTTGCPFAVGGTP